MEKYGVDQVVPDNKTANDKTICPRCGSELQQHGRVHLCPKCGSEPFEKAEHSASRPAESDQAT